jgi:hypothetical protein
MAGLSKSVVRGAKALANRKASARHLRRAINKLAEKQAKEEKSRK